MLIIFFDIINYYFKTVEQIRQRKKGNTREKEKEEKIQKSLRQTKTKEKRKKKRAWVLDKKDIYSCPFSSLKAVSQFPSVLCFRYTCITQEREREHFLLLAMEIARSSRRCKWVTAFLVLLACSAAGQVEDGTPLLLPFLFYHFPLWRSYYFHKQKMKFMLDGIYQLGMRSDEQFLLSSFSASMYVNLSI